MESNTFERFQELPKELRRLIWQAVLAHPRLIEIEGYELKISERLWDSRGDVTEYYRNHARPRVSRKSSNAPAVLQVNQESRGEAMAHVCVLTHSRCSRSQEYCSLSQYHMRCFDTRVAWGQGRRGYIYFNPAVDILYFGQKTCTTTYLRVSEDHAGFCFPRIAILSRGKKCCCYWQGCEPLLVLHGCTVNYRPLSQNPFPGYKGLEEVIWIVKSKALRVKAGDVTEKFYLRPATSNGLTARARVHKYDMEQAIAAIESSTARHWPNWQDTLPAFKWMSLTSVPVVQDRNRSIASRALQMIWPWSRLLDQSRRITADGRDSNAGLMR